MMSRYTADRTCDTDIQTDSRQMMMSRQKAGCTCDKLVGILSPVNHKQLHKGYTCDKDDDVQVDRRCMIMSEQRADCTCDTDGDV